MRAFVVFVLLGSFFWSSCLKKSSGCSYEADMIAAPVSQQQLVKKYLDSAGITQAILDSNGFYYQIVAQGIGASPQPCSQVTVQYKGTLINGAVFDQENNAVYTLGSLIDGWREGLPLIKIGGEIKLYLPPALGYGSSENPSIPANSILIFDIFLLNVQ